MVNENYETIYFYTYFIPLTGPLFLLHVKGFGPFSPSFSSGSGLNFLSNFDNVCLDGSKPGVGSYRQISPCPNKLLSAKLHKLHILKGLEIKIKSFININVSFTTFSDI